MFKSLIAGAIGVRGSLPEIIDYAKNSGFQGVDVSIQEIASLIEENGVIDQVGFLKALDEMGYEGPVSPEPFSQRVRELPPEEAVRETHDGLDKAWKEAGLT